MNTAGLGTGEWFLLTENGEPLRIVMKYDDRGLGIRDLDLPSIREAAQPHSTDFLRLRHFLRQFHNINLRLHNYYEPATENLITLCAKIQEDLLTKPQPVPGKTSEAALLIAMSLRALGCVLNLKFVIDDIYSWELPDSFLQPKATKTERLSFEIWKCDHVPGRVPVKFGQCKGAELSSMLQDILRITQRTLFQRKPKDWPSLFCVLALMKETFDLLRMIDYEPILDAIHALESVLPMLCGLYQVCTKGLHPLVDDWNYEEYASLVGNDELAIAHFRSLNDMWVEGTTS